MVWSKFKADLEKSCENHIIYDGFKLFNKREVVLCGTVNAASAGLWTGNHS